jgi:murein DD-endopeptidase MepM/ murein hydrolase activator NlpD
VYKTTYFNKYFIGYVNYHKYAYIFIIFAKIMEDKNTRKNYWGGLLRKYRFVIMTDSSFEERFSLKLSKANVFVFLVAFFVSCCVVVLFFITKSPLKNYIPGKSNKEVQQQLISLSLQADSLLFALEKRDLYLDNISRVLKGEEIFFEEKKERSMLFDSTISSSLFKTSLSDSLFRVEVESKEKGAVYIERVLDNNSILFFKPLEGIIIDPFSRKNNHFGVDLVGKEKSRISSVLDGVVVFSHWTAETGFVIAVQHQNNYLSLYKHSSLLLKGVGDYVFAGEHLAVIGNSGELTTGPHLHFELWCNGVAVDPEKFITF